MKAALEDIARVLVSCSRSPSTAPSRSRLGYDVTDWSIDSRTLEPGSLFFALRGPNHDGHCYVETAAARGAVAAVVERPFDGITSFIVENVQTALEELARWARERWGGRVVGITGSAGKTTTKEVIAQLLSTEMSVGKTAGNLNNHIGVPLTILRLPEDATAAVIEIGMNHPGEIRQLAGIARPEIGVVTNVGLAHAEFFDSADGVALAKRELIEALPPDGVAVLNADDPKVARFRDVYGGRVITFGFSEGADVRAENAECGSNGARFRAAGVDFDSPLAGRHNVLNVLAGLAVAQSLGIAPARLKDAVRALTPGRMRGERLTHNGITILNDCYNSNPEAVRSMLDVLRATPARRRIAVLGEMLELGRWSEPLHRDIGCYAAGCGIHVLVGIRGAARQMIDEAVRSGMPADAAVFFDDPASAGEWLRGMARPDDAVLFKGSRGTRVERALDKFLEGAPGSSPEA